MEETWLTERLESFRKERHWGICWWDLMMEALRGQVFERGLDAVGTRKPL